jgi:hypothetical protein
MSPTQRSLSKLRKEGWQVCIVEKWIAQAKKRIDAFGFGDILGFFMAPNNIKNGATLFQVTSGTNFAARKKKILEIEGAKGWLMCGNSICIHGWRQLKNKKTGKYHWACKEEWIILR